MGVEVAWEDEFQEKETYPEMDAMWKNIIEGQGQPELNFDEEEEVWVRPPLSFCYVVIGGGGGVMIDVLCLRAEQRLYG